MYSDTVEEPTVGFVRVVHLTRKGQVTVPKQLRQQLQMESGQALLLLQMGEALLLLPEMTEFETVRRRIQDALGKTGRTPDKILATLPEARRRVFEELYGLEEDDDAD